MGNILKISLFPKLVLSIIGIGLIAVCGGNIGNICWKYVYEEKAETEEAEKSDISVNWKEIYPAADDFEIGRIDRADLNESTGLEQKIQNSSEKLLQKLSNLENKMIGFEKIRSLGNKFRKIWCRGGYGVWENRYLNDENMVIEISTEPYKDSVLSDSAMNIALLQKNLQEMEIPFLYIQVPQKSCREDDLPDRLVDYTNLDLDKYAEALSEQNINVLDLRSRLHEQGMEHHALFYNTDHHWRATTGLWAAKEVAEYLDIMYDMELNTEGLNRDRFKEIVYSNAMFGSDGATVGRSIVMPEDFSYYSPIGATAFQLVSIDKGIDITGKFDQALLDTDMLQRFSDLNGGYAYECLCWGNRPLSEIRNLNINNNTRVLIISNSFALALAPYLALVCEEVDLIDIRKGEGLGNFDGSIYAYVQEEKPDIVLMLSDKPRVGELYN